MDQTLEIIKRVVDILVVTYILYEFLSISRGTRSIQMFIFVIAVLGFYLLTQERFFDLPTFRWLLDKFWSIIFLVVVILFQDDIRRSLGRFRFLDNIFKGRGHSPTSTIEEVVRGARSLSSKRMGGLFVLERTGNLEPYIGESGIRLDAYVSKELLFAIFLPDMGNPTHDGAVIIRKDRILAAGRILPLTTRTGLEPWIGTRHRAAMGLTEQVDAAVVVVSEETGRISLAMGGELAAGLSPDELRQALLDVMSEGAPSSLLERVKKATLGRARTGRP